MSNLAKYFREPKVIVELAPDAVLFSQGDTGSSMYVVLEGELEIRVGDRVVDRVSTGRLIGETAIIESLPRSATVTAATACRLASIDRGLFLFLVHETPTFALDVMREMAERLRHAHAEGQSH